MSLVRTDLLKIRRRRGLMAMTLLLAVGSVSVIFIVNAIRHGSSPQTVGPAGGAKAFEDAIDFLGMLTIVVAALIGATAGAGDSELGVLRDVIATGRSRLALFASRSAAAVLVTLAITAASLAVVTVCSIALAGSLPAPSLSEIVQRDAAVLGFAASAALVATGVATFVRSRGPVMASLIAFGVVISQVLLHVSFLGSLRELLPLAAFRRMAGDSLGATSYPLGVAILVAISWALAAVAAGGWWARRVEV
jgi:ABC-type transport system involved in multi-copper enzyme maturation permease subunit